MAANQPNPIASFIVGLAIFILVGLFLMSQCPEDEPNGITGKGCRSRGWSGGLCGCMQVEAGAQGYFDNKALHRCKNFGYTT